MERHRERELRAGENDWIKLVEHHPSSKLAVTGCWLTIYRSCQRRSSLTHHRLSAAIEDVGGHDEDQDREDALERVFAMRQAVWQQHSREAAHKAACAELAAEPTIDQAAQRVIDRRWQTEAAHHHHPGA